MALGGIALVALLGAAWLGRDEIAARWRYRTVRKLLDPAQREDAFRQILGWRRLAGGDATYFEGLPDEEEVIDRVIECPQQGRPPLFVVIFRNTIGQELGDKGALGYHFEPVEYDGTLLRGGTLLFDLNGDGALGTAGDYEWRHGEGPAINVFFLKAVTRHQELLLVVAYHDDSWTWEIRRPGNSPHADVVLGPRNPETDEVETVVLRYRWDPAQGAYVGPAGGLEEDFLRASELGGDWSRIAAELELFARKGGSGGRPLTPDAER